MYHTIKDVSKRTNLTPYTLRYYAKEGLLDFVERNSSGVRIFKESDIEFIYVIECLKHSGLTIKEIKSFVDWCMEGDSTLEQRLEMFRSRKEKLEEQIAALQHILAVASYKCWYYETAMAAGTVAVHDTIKPEEIPADMLATKEMLKKRYHV